MVPPGAGYTGLTAFTTGAPSSQSPCCRSLAFTGMNPVGVTWARFFGAATLVVVAVICVNLPGIADQAERTAHIAPIFWLALLLLLITAIYSLRFDTAIPPESSAHD